MGVVGILVVALGGLITLGAAVIKAFLMGKQSEAGKNAQRELDSANDIQERTNAAIDAGDAVDTSPSSLRDDDGFKRK